MKSKLASKFNKQYRMHKGKGGRGEDLKTGRLGMIWHYQKAGCKLLIRCLHNFLGLRVKYHGEDEGITRVTWGNS